MRFRTLALSFALASALVSFASAEIIDDVRTALARGNFSAAESQLNSYRAQRGVTPGMGGSGPLGRPKMR